MILRQGCLDRMGDILQTMSANTFSWIKNIIPPLQWSWKGGGGYTSFTLSVYPSVYSSVWKQCVTLSWWRHQMERFSALLAICAGNSPVPGEFPTQRPVTQSFDVYFDLRPNKWLSKQSCGWWFEALSWSLWRQRNGSWWHPVICICFYVIQWILILPIRQKKGEILLNSSQTDLGVICFKLHQSLLLRTKLALNYHWFRYLAKERQQAIIWINDVMLYIDTYMHHQALTI